MDSICQHFSKSNVSPLSYALGKTTACFLIPVSHHNTHTHRQKKITYTEHTPLFQRYDHGAGSERVPGRAVVGGQEVRLHHVVDGERGEDAATLG